MATIDDIMTLLATKSKMRDEPSVTTLLQKLCYWTENSDSNRLLLKLQMGRVVALMRQHIDSSNVVKEAMTLIRYVCRNEDSCASMHPYTTDVMTLLQKHASNEEVLRYYYDNMISSIASCLTSSIYVLKRIVISCNLNISAQCVCIC